MSTTHRTKAQRHARLVRRAITATATAARQRQAGQDSLAAATEHAAASAARALRTLGGAA